MNAADIMMYGQRMVLSTLEVFPEHATDIPEACGVWSVKDIIAHLASYECILVDVMSSFTGGGDTPYLDRLLELGSQGFNDAEVARRKDRTLAEVTAELNETHARAWALAKQIPAEVYTRPGALPWYGMEYALDDYIVYQFYGHKREHCAQIAAFRDIVEKM